MSIKIIPLSQVTDAELVRADIVSVEELDLDGGIIVDIECILIYQHDWSKTKHHNGEAYQECANCGAVQKPGQDIDRLERRWKEFNVET